MTVYGIPSIYCAINIVQFYWMSRDPLSRFIKNLPSKVSTYKIRTKSVGPKIIFQKYKFLFQVEIVDTDTKVLTPEILKFEEQKL